MKIIINKIHIDWSTTLFLLLSLISGYFKYSIYLMIILFVHELGHILVITSCHYKINKITLYPFGGITEIHKPINSSIPKNILIALGGVGMQLLLYLLPIHNPYFTYYNTVLILFNLLPIIPLDGSKVMESIYECFNPYEKGLKYTSLVSCILLICFILFNIFTIHNYFMCFVLATEYVILKKQEKYQINKFYLERYLNDYPYHKIKNHSILNIHLLQLNTYHYFYNGQNYLSEKALLKEIYEKEII